MAKAIEVTETKIHCDTCHHEFHGVPQEWKNKPCPECGAENIVNDKDIELWTEAHKSMDFINSLFGEIDPEQADVHWSIRLDTAPYRNADT